ncbi:tyrosine-protein phosphatase Lar-like [Dermacentor variabilis]|uniref:tyrosine-protein phosphatase Lar-like n=1 Tax=Dermacentor variabilis TaxID=34621 RepID=UPI003F5BA1AE
MDCRRMIVTAALLLVPLADVCSLEENRGPLIPSATMEEPRYGLVQSISEYSALFNNVPRKHPILTRKKGDGDVLKEEPIATNVTGDNDSSRFKVTVKKCNGRCHADPGEPVDTKGGSPSAVKNLSVNQTVPGEVVYSWQRPDNPNGPLDGYIVTTGNLETKKVLITEVPGNATQLVQKTIEQYTEYKVDVQAYNIMNPYGLKQAGPAASVQFKSLGKGPVPPIPEVGDTFEHEVLVNWTKPINLGYNVTHYVIRLIETAVDVRVNNTSVWLECLETWHPYTASVSSCIASDACGPPKKVSFETDVGTPDSPMNFNCTSLARYSVGLAWTRPEQVRGPLDGYKVTFANSSMGFDVITKATALTVGNLSANCIYKISVSAFNHGVHQTKEGPATVIEVKTMYGPKPAPPWFSITTITLMIVVPVVCFVLLAVYIVYKQVLKRRQVAITVVVTEVYIRLVLS